MAELLAPAGNIESLEAAVDALHRLGKKIYVTVNTVCEEHEMEKLYRLLCYLDRVKPDGLIVQDFAVIRMAQEFFPTMELHASTQMNVESAAGVHLLSREGVKRVVRARGTLSFFKFSRR